MTTSIVHDLTCIATVRVQTFCPNPKLANCRLDITTEAYGEDGVFYPAQTVQVYGTGIAKLREILNAMPPD